MRKLLLLIVALACVALTIIGRSSAFYAPQDIPKESKTQPKKVVLAKDSQSDKYGEVAFDHENHTLKNYVDGKSQINCTHCHHTDQPKTDLKAPYVTSERT